MDRKQATYRYVTSGGGTSENKFSYVAGKKKRKKNIRGLIRVLAVVAVVAALLVVVVLNFLDQGGRAGIGRVTKIAATITQNISTFDDRILYYDGTTIHCVLPSGANEWSYQIGTNADYDAAENKIVAWSGNELYILNSRGRLIYNNKMSDSIQFASAGKAYCAAFIGSADNGVVTVIDGEGRVIDNIPVEAQTLLDIGFFEATTSSSTQTTEYMWMLGLDTSGTVISTQLQTFQPGRLSTGKTSLGDYISYKIFAVNGILNIVTTREILHYTYRAVEDSSSTLIYGYTLRDVRKNGNTVYQLLIPSIELSGGLTVSNVRLMYGNVNRMIHLPGKCITALLGSRCIYGFSQDTIYACRFDDTTFTAYPLDIPLTNVLGMISDNRAVVASGSSIYIVELPL
ncbi:MAG: hypothetical protein IJ088_16780 [Clostridia bacterium]|nr:hypothetical protein [Clostridia bacterium]